MAGGIDFNTGSIDQAEEEEEEIENTDRDEWIHEQHGAESPGEWSDWALPSRDAPSLHKLTRLIHKADYQLSTLAPKKEKQTCLDDHDLIWC